MFSSKKPYIGIMKKESCFFLLIMFLVFSSSDSFTQTSEVDRYSLLLYDHQSIREDNIMNEEILDLVDVYTIDSTFKRKTERHQIVGGVVLRAFGFRWKTINYKREKFVGTVSWNYIPDDQNKREGELFTEYDVNFDLYPNLEKYKGVAHKAYLAQAEMFKARKKVNEDEVPFIFPDSTADLTKYRMHCECTPHADFRDVLNDQFYPARQGMRMETHPNFGEKNPSMGLYGAYVLDCNHKCHPEIHPYEWMWWLDVNPKKEHDPYTKVWNFTFMRDNSKRFKHWSSVPRIGEISFPFVFPLESNNKVLRIEHSFYNKMEADRIKDLNLHEDVNLFDAGLSKEFVSAGEDPYIITVNWNQSIASKGIAYYFSDMNLDMEKKLVYGKLNIAMAVRDIYVGKFISSFDEPVNYIHRYE